MAAEWDVFASEITITAAVNDTIRIREDGAGTIDVALPAGTYYLIGTGDGLADALSDAINSESTLSGTGAGYTVTCVFSTTAGQPTATFTIATDATSLQILSAGTDFDLTQIGFPQSDSAAAASISSSLSPTATWLSDQPYVVRPDEGGQKSSKQLVAVDGTRYTFNMADRITPRVVGFDSVTPDRTRESESTGDTARTFEAFRELTSDGRKIKMYRKAEASAGTLDTVATADLVETYVQELTDGYRSRFRRGPGGVPLYAWTWRLWKQ